MEKAKEHRTNATIMKQFVSLLVLSISNLKLTSHYFL